jgi:Uma2 family endonuclease
MISANILTRADDVELLEGWIVPKVVRTPLHDAALDQVADTIRSRLPEGWRVRDQKAITLADSEPEPDLAVVRGPATRYRDHHPAPGEIALVVEISVTTLGEDRVVKGRLYARAGIPSYWIINLVDSIVEVYLNPDSTGSMPCYRQRRDYRPGDHVPFISPLEQGATLLLPVTELLQVRPDGL